MNDHNEPNPEEIPVSKTLLKKEMLRLQALGEKLIALKEVQLDKLPLGTPLRAAIDETRQIKSREGLRRHKQYIGRLMRDIDSEAIASFVEHMEKSHQLNTREFHHLEELREKLIAGGNEVIGEVIAKHQQVDRQKLRQLVRKAKKERQLQQENPSDPVKNKSSRELFRFLRDLHDVPQ